MGTHSHTSFLSTFAGLLRSAADFFRAWKQRRELTCLADLDDRMLADIGLTRYNVSAALAEPLSVDASESLATMARQSSRQASAEAFAPGGRDLGESRKAA